MTTLTERIAAFTSALDYDGLPNEVREKCKVSLLHNLGMAVAGGPLLSPVLAYAQALGEGGSGASARLLLSGKAATPDTAALVNAALTHSRAQDDVYFPGLTHVGATISPAILAVGEQLGSSGKELITALTAGYEAAGAISQDFAKRTTARGFRASGIFGVFGSAAGVARLLGLDATATANTLGIAANMAAGTNQTWVAGTDEWQIQVGMAARNGILAARLAAAGCSAAPDALEGRAGFYTAFMGDLEQVAEVGKDLGTVWRSLDVTYKPYPVCAILQGPVREAIMFAGERQIKTEDIAAVRLMLPPAEAAYPGTDSKGPYKGTGAALMSSQFCLAVALAQRRFKGADLRRLDDPTLKGLIHKIEVHPKLELHARSFILELDFADGQTFRRSFTPTGQPFNWERDEVTAQLQSMVDELPIGPKGLVQLCKVVLSAENHTARQIVDACCTESAALTGGVAVREEQI